MCFLTDHNTTSCWWHARRSPPSSSHLLQSTGFTEISLYRNDENQAEPSCGVLNRLWACLIFLSRNINLVAHDSSPWKEDEKKEMKNDMKVKKLLKCLVGWYPYSASCCWLFFHSKTRCFPMVRHFTFDIEGFFSIRAACICSTVVSWIEWHDELEGMWRMLCHMSHKREKKSCSSSTLTRKNMTEFEAW